jgi:Xaa-Pro aminopeptidase
VILRRLELIRRKMAETALDALVVSSNVNRRWLTGFTGSAGTVILGPERSLLLVDFRYIEQAKLQAAGFEQLHYQQLYPVLRQALADMGVKQAGFEAAHVVHKTWQRLRQDVPDVEWVPVDTWVEEARGQKSPEELAALRQAIVIADDAFAKLLPDIRPGVSEREVALQLELLMRRAGAERIAFDIIVVSGARGALPHGGPTDKLLERGDLVTLDFGAVWHGYHSDITRTVALGEADARQREIYELVLRAQKAGLAAVAVGRTGKEVDAKAREVIVSAGFGEFFGHGLGHGVGLEIHEEYPRLSVRGEVTLRPNMVCSVEPGIYVPGWGGVRIEDLVVVTESGAQVLTASPKELLVL